MLAMNRKIPQLAAIGVAALVCIAIGAEPSPKTENVTIQGTSFSPATVKINVGDTVVWTNSDDSDYTVIASDNSFSSGNIGSGKTYEHKFTRAGSFAYYCKYHPRMKGTVVVSAGSGSVDPAKN